MEILKKSFNMKLLEKIIKLSKSKKTFQIDDKEEFWNKVSKMSFIAKAQKPNKLILKNKYYKIEDTNLIYLKNKKIKQAKNLLVYYNGGAWIFGFSILHYKRLEEIMNVYEADAIAVNYPLFPKNTGKNIRDYFIKIYPKIEKLAENKKLILIGDSAGGHSAMVQTILAKKENRRIPDKLILLSPALYADLEYNIYKNYEKKDIMLSPKASDILLEKMLGEDINNKSDSLISPGRADLSYFPKIEIHVGTSDIICAQVKYFYENNKNKASIDLTIYENLIHVFMIFKTKERKMVHKLIKENKNNYEKSDSKTKIINYKS